ncbi:Alpha/Beta hydrolase protein [Xylariomycetidae sp. FL0641]|nr:Alpha/Beta hydrolase protein [Xylariomycetidae sp. FL0641]
MPQTLIYTNPQHQSEAKCTAVPRPSQGAPAVNMEVDLPPLALPEGVSEAYIDCSSSCGLRFHVLQSGSSERPLVLFCHGFPELAYSWRHVLPRVAAAGYRCVAVDQRGYGRTTGWPACASHHDADLRDYVPSNLVRDLVCLVHGLGHASAACIVGHDFGAVSAAAAALTRPDVFRASVHMSHPHHAPPRPGQQLDKGGIQAQLAGLDPPRKHYKWYNATPEAAGDWARPPQGLAAFLRGYFHVKSAAWAGNAAPRPLRAWSAEELRRLPAYYVMRRGESMPRTVARLMDGEDAAATERWLPPGELQVYVDEWRRVGFQGALNWYRAQTEALAARDLLLFAGRRIEVPCVFVSGEKDWGNYQQPGALEGYEDPGTVKDGCFRGVRLIADAGHWVQQEQPEAVVREILAFLETL